ncbi:MAG: amino acid adenylation domain-containing protein, partial [Catenulispora sp.]|nr:amino acid adenylation domain-containing protein [Catenulispora sp.]
GGRALRDLGLDSLAATRLVLELQAEFGVEVPMARLGECRGAAEVATLVAELAAQSAAGPAAGGPGASARDSAADGAADRADGRSRDRRSADVRPDPAGRLEPFALTAVQQAYLAGRMEDLTADPVGCHIYREFELDDIDPDRLRGAWEKVVERNDILRSVLTADGRQQILPEAPAWKLPVHEAADDTAIRRIREGISHRRYPPGQWPPFAIELTRRPAGADVVHLSIDASVTDGRGLDLLLDQWWHAYQDPDKPLEPAEFEVRDCVQALLAQADSPAWERDLQYWRARLVDLPPGPAIRAEMSPEAAGDTAQPIAESSTEPATDPAGESTAGDAAPRRYPLTATLDAQQWAALRERAAAAGVTPTALVLTVFADTFARWGTAGRMSLVLTTSQRGRLPAAAGTVVGPFTSTCVFVVDDLSELELDDAARAVGRQLWEDLDHGLVSGIEALRALRVREPELPVVFTSLLDESGPAAGDGFTQAVSYALSQTSGVVVDAQMWEAGDELRLRWDVSQAAVPGGPQVCFAAFVNALVAVSVDKAGRGVRRPLNELQQAYYVAAVSGGGGGWDGCQVYHAFDVEDLDLGRLQDAWAGMLADYEALRTEVTADGELVVREGAPATWLVPVVADAPDGLGRDLVRRAFPLGRWPRFDLRVSGTPGAGAARVHLTLDLIVCDGRSVHFLMRELFRRYAQTDTDTDTDTDTYADADIGSEVVAAPRPTGSFEAYAAWQQDQLRSPQLPQWRAHWRDRAAATPAGPPLPMADAVGGERSRLRRTARVGGWPGLRARAQKDGVSPDALLVSALTRAFAEVFQEPFAVPLVRWSEQFGPWRPGEYTALSWIAHRPELGLWEQAAANQAVIEADARCDAVSGLAEVRRAALRGRDSGHSGYPVVATGLLELAAEPLPAGVTAGPWATCTPDVSVDCIAMECGDDELRVFWDVVEADFAPGAVDRVFEAYLRSLRALAAGQEPETAEAVADLASESRSPSGSGSGSASGPALEPAERRKILVDWNDTARPFAADGPVHLAFQEQARLRPGAVALRWRGGTMTYRDLNRRANAVAERLRTLGVGAGVVVGICLDRGPEMVAAVYGVLKAGGAYLPIEPYLPAARALGMLAESQAKVLVTSGAGTPTWQQPPDVATLDLAELAVDAGTDENPEPVNGADDIAYIIYTSGSTGRPKGVVVTHRPLHNLLAWCHRMFGFDSSDVGLCVTSLGFDLSAFDLLGLLGRGAGVYIADAEQQRDPELLLEVLRTEPITFWNSAPTTLAQLAPLFPAAGAPGTERLRLVFLSGDYTPLTLPPRLAAAFPNAHLVSLGGATEATIWSNYFPVQAVDPRWRSIPYGRPIDNCRYYVLDEAGQPCPPGVEGDLFIAGSCLSSGYVGRPDLTAERFVPDPHADTPGELMYRTGDRAAYFPDGVIDFRGRLDGQVKIRGFRVELGEIEHRLSGHPAVADVVVVARPDEAGDRALVAYVIPEAGQRPSVPDLRAYAAQALPDYMVPNHVGFVDRLPATANGKLDRDALPWPLPAQGSAVATEPVTAEPDPGAAQADSAEPGPEPDTAQLVAELSTVFAELLGVQSVDTASDLWNQGATSFTMVRLSGMVRQRYGRRIPVSTLLADPTVEGIARAVAGPRDDARPAPAEPAPAEVPNVDFFDPASRAAFHDGRWNMRPADGQAEVLALPDTRVAQHWYAWRASQRDFAPEALPAADLGRLLSLLRPARDGDRDRCLYPSAGDTYSVQVYVRVLGERVAGLAAGVYYYQPAEHALRLVNAAPSADRGSHFYYNREIRDRAAFELYLVGQTRGIEPLYGADSSRYLAVEAGHIAQLLMSGQAAAGSGLCPIGAVADEALRTDLALDEGHRLLLTFLGGPVTWPDPPPGVRLPYEATTPKPVAAAPEGATVDSVAASSIAQPTTTIAPVAVSKVRRDPRAADIAITGMAGRFPGAEDLQTLWRNLLAGRTAVAPLDARRAAALGVPQVRGGFLTDVESFDALRFRIAPSEAATVDPQARLVLEAVWRCLEDAGWGGRPAQLGRVGVFVGSMWPDFQLAGADAWRAGDQATLSGIAADLPNRVSHAFWFTGPSIAVDTSCSSSLTALHLAVQSIRAGECTAAVVAGVNLIGHPYHLALLNGLDLIGPAASGAFDADAPGWTPGEGVAAILVRPAAAAAADRDLVHGVIEGT